MVSSTTPVGEEGVPITFRIFIPVTGKSMRIIFMSQEDH